MAAAGGEQASINSELSLNSEISPNFKVEMSPKLGCHVTNLSREITVLNLSREIAVLILSHKITMISPTRTNLHSTQRSSVEHIFACIPMMP